MVGAWRPTASPCVYHPKLPEMLFSSFFKLCRLQGMSFDIRNKTGVVFDIYDSMACGVMGMLTIGPSAPAATRVASKVMLFMKKHIGSRTAAGAAAIARGEDDGLSGFLEFDDAIKENKADFVMTEGAPRGGVCAGVPMPTLGRRPHLRHHRRRRSGGLAGGEGSIPPNAHPGVVQLPHCYQDQDCNTPYHVDFLMQLGGGGIISV